MTEAHPSGIGTVELFRETWRLLQGHARLFVLLMGVPILAQLLAVIVMAILILPLRPGESLREAWLAMDEWRKVAIALLFLAILAVIYRVHLLKTTAESVECRISTFHHCPDGETHLAVPRIVIET